MNKLVFRLVLILVLLAAPLLTLSNSKPATALTGSQFNPGRIIDDSLFFDGSSMTAAQIQGFLNSKVPACDTWGNQPYNGTTRGNYGASRGNPPPYNCLRDYQQNIPGRPADQYCSGSVGSGIKSAAQIIKDVAAACSVSPKVLIVTLQKEQSLITDDWPWPVQYTKATGYGCPDTAPCDPEFAGFFNQVWYAARQFQRYAKLPNSYAHKAGQTNYVRYHPNAACGGTNVFIHNQATAGLYNYTPYQPNQAALNNLYGTGDGCSAYGNRNFWRLYNDWFGNTQLFFEPLLDPRWMQLNTSAHKISVVDGQEVDEPLEAGRQLKILSKVYINTLNQWCFRTEFDTVNNLLKCIPSSNLNELDIATSPIVGGKVFEVKEPVIHKIDIRRSKNIGEALPEGRQIEFATTTTVGGVEYFISEFDENYNNEFGIRADNLRETQEYNPVSPVWFELKNNSYKTLTSIGQNRGLFPKGMVRKYNSRVSVSGDWYYRTESDTASMLALGIAEDNLRNLTYEAFLEPRWLQVNQGGYKSSPFTQTPTGVWIGAGSQLKFTSKIFVNGAWYYRTEFDTNFGYTESTIPASNVSEISFQSMENPRYMRLTQNSRKFIPALEQHTGEEFPAGLVIQYQTKININGVWYLRTSYDTHFGYNTAIPLSILSDL